jgi:hypothetical protein
MPIELSLLRSFGYEVYSPKIIPNDPGYRSAVVDYSWDSTLSLDPYIIDYLNRHSFYDETWSATLTDILNENFQLLITSWSGYTTPLFEAIRKFNGATVARVFGRENPARYSDFIPLAIDAPILIDRIERGASKFWFGQAFDNLCEIEHPAIQAKALNLPVGLPGDFFEYEDTWIGDSQKALFLCPNIVDSAYYGNIYNNIVNDFKLLPMQIFGRQIKSPDDDRVLPYMPDADLYSLYQHARLMIYPSVEPRHLHYSPLEAMIIGTPVIYKDGGLLERLAGSALPGQCGTAEEMNEKAKRILGGDQKLIDAIRSSQKVILEKLSDRSVHQQWVDALEKIARNEFTVATPDLVGVEE